MDDLCNGYPVHRSHCNRHEDTTNAISTGCTMSTFEMIVNNAMFAFGILWFGFFIVGIITETVCRYFDDPSLIVKDLVGMFLLCCILWFFQHIL